MRVNFKKIGNVLFVGYVYFAFIWVICAITFEVFMIGVHFTNEELATRISNEIEWKIDGVYRNNPDNIWYEEPVKK